MRSCRQGSLGLAAGFLLGGALSLGCSTDLVMGIPDANNQDANGSQAASTVLEHLIVVGSWTFGPRFRNPECESECYEVTRWNVAEDGQTLAVIHYFDVAPAAIDPINPDGKRDGDEYCRSIYTLRELQDAALDTNVRSAVEITIETSTCGEFPRVGIPMLLDSPVALGGALVPELLSSFIPSSGTLIEAWPGFPEAAGDLQYATALLPCAEADYAPGREYCAPTCDFPVAATDRTLCGFPEWPTPTP